MAEKSRERGEKLPQLSSARFLTLVCTQSVDRHRMKWILVRSNVDIIISDMFNVSKSFMDTINGKMRRLKQRYTNASHEEEVAQCPEKAPRAIRGELECPFLFAERTGWCLSEPGGRDNHG